MSDIRHPRVVWTPEQNPGSTRTHNQAPRRGQRRNWFNNNRGKRRDPNWRIIESYPVVPAPGPGAKGGVTKKGISFPPSQVPSLVQMSVSVQGPRVAETFPIITEDLTIENYEEKFHHLLWVEETEDQIEMKQYNLFGVQLKKYYGNFYELDVPGLAEGRPSIQAGDSVHIKRPEESSGFEGQIHAIKLHSITLKFDPEFRLKFKKDTFDVEFKVSRMHSRRCHWVIEEAIKTLPEKFLFPNQEVNCDLPPIEKPANDLPLIQEPAHNLPRIQEPARNLPRIQEPVSIMDLPLEEGEIMENTINNNFIDDINWINKSLNERQRIAVSNIMKAKCRPCPYIIFGPPGTGKTLTLVECILQVFKSDPESRILACGVSNACADYIAIKLLESGFVDRKSMIRVIALSRQGKVPPQLECYSRVADEDVDGWLSHRIVIATCSTVGSLVKIDLPGGQFTHSFIDEAAQATEPETLLAIIETVQNHGTSVLVGDPKQLGPIVRSPVAQEHGLGISLMERLCGRGNYMRETFIYPETGHYDPGFITKLVESHRCCAELIQVNSDLFYDSELICKPPMDTDLMARMDVKFPIIFHSVIGLDLQERDSPSWLNREEVDICVDYLFKLYQTGLTDHDIGIITPYRKQAARIRDSIQSRDAAVCKVATIEEFQGGERKVIILSMVRSSERYLEHDQKFGLGFVFNVKRFNVATSRAKSMLIVVGNPNLLMRDDNWKGLINYCQKNNSLIGESLITPQISDLNVENKY